MASHLRTVMYDLTRDEEVAPGAARHLRFQSAVRDTTNPIYNLTADEDDEPPQINWDTFDVDAIDTHPETDNMVFPRTREVSAFPSELNKSYQPKPDPKATKTMTQKVKSRNLVSFFFFFFLHCFFLRGSIRICLLGVGYFKSKAQENR